MSSEPIIVRMKHIRAARICASGARHWFLQRGWNWTQFLASGRAVEDFEDSGDTFAMRVAEIAREEAARGR